jgi:trigger factor
MNISKELKDELNAVVKVQISKEDYEPKVKKVLSDYQKKARIDGFRPGKVPVGLIQKLYGKTAMVEEINKLLSDSILKYIQDEQLHILGDPLPSEKEQKPIDWETQTEFEFVFELGLSPEFELKISDKDKFTAYTIVPGEKAIESYLDNYARRYGSFVSCDTIEDGKEMLKGSFIEMTPEGTVKDNGIATTESSIYLEFMKDEDIKKQIMGLKQNDVITFNLRKAYPNEVEIATILHKKKEEVANIDSDFQLTIAAISKFQKAELNQELFDKIYGEGTVTSEEEFKAKVQEEVKANLNRESDYKFRVDAKEAILKKVNFTLPVDFLKRWVFSSNEGKFTQEQIEQDFPKFEQDLKWQLIQNKVIKDHDLKISDEELLEFAKAQTKLQFEQYGLFNVPEEHLVNYAQESLKREEDRRKLFERKYEDKVLDFVRETAKVETKEITSEEFDKLFEENNN